MMIALERGNGHRVAVRLVLWLSVALAAATALAYVLIARDMLGVGDLQTEESSPVIVYVAAGAYLVGGLLILLRRRWLWGSGAVINALVMLMFLSAYLDRPSVLFSPGGLATKSAQLLLELGLLYLILTSRHAGQHGGNTARLEGGI